MELNYVGVSQENGKAKTFANEYLDKTLFQFIFNQIHLVYISISLFNLTFKIRFI